MKAKTKFYITTPIYYPNDVLHMGHAYTNIVADVFSRYHKMQGKEVFFSTGSDEHGQKIEQKALEAKQQPLDYVNKILKNFYKLWESLKIDYTAFNRTTNPKHEKLVQEIFEKLLAKKYIYLDKYIGYYCVSDETHFSPEEVTDNLCPACNKEVKKIEEESYFLKVSQFQDWIINYIKNWSRHLSRK